MKRALTCLLVLAFATLLNGRQFRCDYTYFSQVDGWLKLHRIPADWREARLRCHLEGSYLASPLNAGLSSVMRSVMRQKNLKNIVFTGINSLFSRGDFHSVEGIPLSEIPHTWFEGEPNNLDNEESCLAMLESGELADVKCTVPLPYLCYRKAQGAVVGNCGTVDSEYKLESRTGSCYKFHKVPRPWSRAYMACSAEGGHLAIINSETEAQVIREIFAKYPVGSVVGNFGREDFAFIGFQDWGEHNSVDLLTIEGQTLNGAGYGKFDVLQPSNLTTGQYCGAVHRNGRLFNLWCEVPYAFICEKRPASLVCRDEQRVRHLRG